MWQLAGVCPDEVLARRHAAQSRSVTPAPGNCTLDHLRVAVPADAVSAPALVRGATRIPSIREGDAEGIAVHVDGSLLIIRAPGSADIECGNHAFGRVPPGTDSSLAQASTPSAHRRDCPQESTTVESSPSPNFPQRINIVRTDLPEPYGNTRHNTQYQDAAPRGQTRRDTGWRSKQETPRRS